MLGAAVMVHMKKTTSHVHTISDSGQTAVTALARTSSQHLALHESELFRDTPSKLEPAGLFMGQTIPDSRLSMSAKYNTSHQTPFKTVKALCFLGHHHIGTCDSE